MIKIKNENESGSLESFAKLRDAPSTGILAPPLGIILEIHALNWRH
jgi:hypothetical protein